MYKRQVVLIGVENQSDIHYAIPVKHMFYDVMAYGNQVKETAKRHRKKKDTATSDEFLSGFTKEDKLIPRDFSVQPVICVRAEA